MPSAGFLFASQPVCLSRNCSDLPRHVLGCRASSSSGLPSQLAFRHLMVGAGTGHQTETAIGPQLPLGSKPVWGLQNTQQFSGSNRTDRWNLTQPFPHLVFLAFRHQISSYFLAQGSQHIQLLVVQLRPPAHSRFMDLCQPLRPMPRSIDLLPLQGMAQLRYIAYPGHHPTLVAGDGQITSP